MEAYAVIETGGKQYRVQAGELLEVELLAVEKGAQTDLTSVLARSDGVALIVGAPLIAGAKVTVEVVEHKRGPKVIAFKKRKRKGSKRKVGHRQELTMLKILSVT
ncbi:MAG: 50S ribosomal protein L21 [bacterium]